MSPVRLLPFAAPFHLQIPHACGHVVAQFSEAGLRSLLLLPHGHPLPEMDHQYTSRAEVLRAALGSYFAGRPEQFQSFPLDFDHASEFQQSVWRESTGTGWGSTSSYGELAARLGLAPGAARAVGRALGANPLHLVVPCHRYLSGAGDLVDFAGGLEWKRYLLQREGSLLL